MVAFEGASSSAISIAMLKRAVMKPTPTLARARKWVASMTSIDSTPGPQEPTWLGSMRNAQVFSRDAAISTVPSKCICSSARRSVRGRRVRDGILDEARPAADAAEGVDDAAVLGDVP